MSEPAEALVDTILAVTPDWAVVYGDRRRLPARQAAATLRWLADHLLDTYRGTCGCGCDCSSDLRELADQLDTQETP